MLGWVYSITHVATGRHYIGSSRNVRHRHSAHRSLLRAGKHHSPHLQRAWLRYGESAFAFCILEECDVDDLLQMEQVWIDRLHAGDPTRGFNTALVAGTRAGVPHSEESRKKMSDARKGKPKSAEHRAKIGVGNTGKIRTEEVKHRIAKTLKDAVTDEYRIRQAEYAKLGNGTKGKKMSVEARANMSVAKKRQAATPEGRAMLLRNLGTKH